MKLTITAAALATLAGSVPAAAQMTGYGQSNQQPMQQTPEIPMPYQPSQTADQSKQQKQQPQAGGIQPSKHALKVLVDLQNAVKAKDTANIPAKIAAAQAAAQTKEDRYLIGELELDAAIDAKDNAAAAAAIDAMAATGVSTPAKTAKLYKGIGELFYQAKQYDKAVAAFSRSAALDPQDYDLLDLIGESYNAAGQKEQASTAFLKSIQARSAAGQKAQELIYKKALQLAYDARSPNTIDIARQWIAAYPSATAWNDTVGIYRDLNRPDTEGTIDLLRLLRANNALSTPSEYALYVADAAEQLNYNEAQAALDAGIAAHVIDPSNGNFASMISILRSKQKATAADLQAAVKMSPTPVNLLRIGDRYYGMGDYSQAADIYRQVLTKPGADKDVANLHLGMALARSGDKAGATAALNSVAGANSGIAKLWLLYVQTHA